MSRPQQRDFSALNRKAAPLRDAEPTRKPGRPSTGRSSRGIGLPAALAERMAAASEAAGQSYGDWLMAAFNGVYDALAESYPPLPQYRAELPPPRRPPRRRVPGRQAVNFRLTSEQLAAIDARQRELAVESRSEFVSEIVRLALACSA